MTWQIYNKNLRKSSLLVEYFSFLDKFDPILSSVIDDPNKKKYEQTCRYRQKSLTLQQESASKFADR